MIRHIAIAVLFCVGCGGNLPEVAPLSGVVEYNGKPLSGFDNAAVEFTPAGGRPAKGIVSKGDGLFQLTTYTSGDGARLGNHQVAVSATVNDPHANTEDKYPGVRSVIPEEFANRDRSGLTCEVEPGGNFVRIKIQSDGTGVVVKE
jgi:hypothetical protein